MKDPTGELGVAALCGIGALAGGLISYAGQVIQNYCCGATGPEAWVDVDWGDVASSAFSGAVSAIPGGGLAAELIDTVGSNVIRHGVNSFINGTQFDIAVVGNEIVSDLISDAIMPDVIPDIEVPRYIRDIKQEARDAGVKGTRKLQAYLNFVQVATIITNAFNSSTSEMILEMY